ANVIAHLELPCWNGWVTSGGDGCSWLPFKELQWVVTDPQFHCLDFWWDGPAIVVMGCSPDLMEDGACYCQTMLPLICMLPNLPPCLYLCIVKMDLHSLPRRRS
ncbi:hypothetical protein ACLOJK_018609, partial [Asimina triloba]